MTKRQVVIDALEFRRPAYVPWAVELTIECADRLRKHLGTEDLDAFLEPHFVTVVPKIHDFEQVGPDLWRDHYGVTWDRSVDKDIGLPVDWPLKEPALEGYTFPDPEDPAWYEGLAEQLEAAPDCFTRFAIGFSVYERAWSMRGMENFLMDMIEHPDFVDELLDAICEHNLALIRRAIDLGVDCIHFGDDYGSQRGLIMGIRHWRRFIKPRLARMYAAVREAGKYVSQHSCGRVQELFDDLVEMGLRLFNPFQPEVMDVFEYKRRYHGKLAFHGGMSIQQTLPFGSVDEVRRQTQRLIDAGRDGGYVFAPSHAVPRDVPPENLVAMMEVLKAQPGVAAGHV